MIQAPEGRIFISPDLPQADARIVAWDAQCLSMIQVLEDPTRHIHLENCNRLFNKKLRKGIPEANEYQLGDEYKQGKAMLHAANYRMSPRRLAVELGIDVGQAKSLMDSYFRLYPEIPQWQESILGRIKQKGFLTTPPPFNRTRLFYTAMAERINTGKVSTEAWNSACSWIPQSAVADIINWGLRRLKDEYHDVVWCHKHDHDSYLCSIPEDRQLEIIPRAIEMLQIPLRIHSRTLTMVPEMAIGYNYGLLIPWQQHKLERDTWWDRVKGRMDEGRLRKELYGYV